MQIKYSRDLNIINITGFKFNLYVIKRTCISHMNINLHLILEKHKFRFL